VARHQVYAFDDRFLEVRGQVRVRMALVARGRF
jgi:hypothetical protein